MSDARRYAVWPEPRSRSRSLKGSRPSVPHGTNFFVIKNSLIFLIFEIPQVGFFTVSDSEGKWNFTLLMLNKNSMCFICKFLKLYLVEIVSLWGTETCWCWWSDYSKSRSYVIHADSSWSGDFSSHEPYWVSNIFAFVTRVNTTVDWYCAVLFTADDC